MMIINDFFYLLLHGKLLWHFELQRIDCLLHRHLFEEQLLVQQQRTYPCPDPIELQFAALRSEISLSFLTWSRVINTCVQVPNSDL